MQFYYCLVREYRINRLDYWSHGSVFPWKSCSALTRWFLGCVANIVVSLNVIHIIQNSSLR